MNNLMILNITKYGTATLVTPFGVSIEEESQSDIYVVKIE